MIRHKEASNPPDPALDILAGPAVASAEGCGEDLSPELRGELLDAEAWNKVLEKFARTTRLAVALSDTAGHLLGECHNPQPVWRMMRAAWPLGEEACPFCLAPPGFCTAARDASEQGTW